MTSSSQHRSKSSGRSRPKTKTSAVKVKCSFCGNTFYAVPKEAICPKCSRPANRNLPAVWRAASLLVPPFGLIYGLIIRLHSPIAGMQGLLFSILGALIYSAIWVARSQFGLF